MRSSLLRRRGLGFPGGFTPGFDPSHPAAKGIPRFSGIVSGQGMVNLLTGKPGAVSGAPTFVMDGTIGPAAKFSSGTDAYTFGGQSTANDQTGTIALIARLNSVSTNQGMFQTSSTDAGIGIGSSTGPMAARTNAANNTIPWQDFAFTNTAGFPFFVGISVNGTTCNSIIRRLDTGRWNSATQTLAGAPTASNGTYVVGNFLAFSVPALSNIGAAMFSTAFLSVNQLLAWSMDPWSFWYPAPLDFALDDEIMAAILAAAVYMPYDPWPQAAPVLAQ